MPNILIGFTAIKRSKARDAGIVHQNVYAAHFLANVRDGGCDRIWIRDIQGKGSCAAAAFPCDRFTGRKVKIGDRDQSAFLGKKLGRRTAHAAGSASDNRNAARD